ncbi:MAG: hypothetical protein V7641_1574 [Blastocatellia bacterium]
MQSPQGEAENLIEGKNSVPVEAGAANPAPGNGVAGTPPAIKFGRMFADLTRFRPDNKKLIELGKAMLHGPDLGEHPDLLAGYTYLGQFITHDMTFDHKREMLPEPVDEVTKIQQDRTLALSLETLYGIGKPSDNASLYDDHAALPERTYFKVGVTDPETEGGASCSYRNDLPRVKNQNKAMIGDERNDANLALAQLTVAFLRFHNRVVDHLKSNNHLNEDTLFEKARKMVVQHFQWIVLKDFLPKIIETEVLESVLEPVLKDARENRPRNLDGKWPFIPVEFSVAAFRLGHSMVRSAYEWNRNFQTPNPKSRNGAVPPSDLFLLTGRDGTMGEGGGALPSRWIIDWTRFFDFNGFNGIANNPKFNLARKIDTSLSPGLRSFKDFISTVIADPDLRSLPVLDLIRGSRLGLPTGQDVAGALKVDPLAATKIANGPHQEILKTHHFDEQTPLWYYILKEAEVLHEGKCLGPVGSRIVAETVIELMWVSQHSILKEPNWRPELWQKKEGEFGMADLLVFANVVNPLGC